MTPTPPADFAFSFNFDDFDQFAEAAVAWDLDFRPLRRASAATRLTQLGSTQLQIARAELGCHCEQLGSTPAGFLTYAVPLAASSPIIWAHQAVETDTLLVFGSNRELDAASLPAFDVYTLSLSEAVLSQCEPGRRLLEFSTSRGRQLQCPAADIARLRDALGTLFDGVFAATALPGSPLLPPGLGEGLAELLWQAVAGAVGERERPLAHHKRSRILAQARDWIAASPGQALSVAAMSDALGIPERSLRRAFVDQFGIAPKEYLRAQRLIGVRRVLLAGGAAGASVARTAADFGFWHGSQFAADYRRLFGELPSDTLARIA